MFAVQRPLAWRKALCHTKCVYVLDKKDLSYADYGSYFACLTLLTDQIKP